MFIVRGKNNETTIHGDWYRLGGWRGRWLVSFVWIRRLAKLATLYIDLTEDEEWAILTHDGLYDFMKYEIPGRETQLSLILHWADLWSAKITEAEEDTEEE